MAAAKAAPEAENRGEISTDAKASSHKVPIRKTCSATKKLWKDIVMSSLKCHDPVVSMRPATVSRLRPMLSTAALSMHYKNIDAGTSMGGHHGE